MWLSAQSVGGQFHPHGRRDSLDLPVSFTKRVRSMKTVLTTTDINERKRAQFWQDAVCDTFVELDCQMRADRPFFGELSTTQCDGLHFSNVRSETQIVRRTRTRIRRAREEVMLISLQVSGDGVITQDGREAHLRPGDFACYDSTRPYTLQFNAAFEQLVLHMPREAMVRRIGRTEAWTARRVEAASPVGSLVLPFVRRTAAVVSERHACDREPTVGNLPLARYGGTRRTTDARRRSADLGAHGADVPGEGSH